MERVDFASRLGDPHQRGIIEIWIDRLKQAEQDARSRGEEPGPAVIFQDPDGNRWGLLDVNDAIEVALSGA
jgi:hypothetical protein